MRGYGVKELRTNTLPKKKYYLFFECPGDKNVKSTQNIIVENETLKKEKNQDLSGSFTHVANVLFQNTNLFIIAFYHFLLFYTLAQIHGKLVCRHYEMTREAFTKCNFNTYHIFVLHWVEH